MQRKSWIVVAVALLVLGLAIGWLSSGYIAAKGSERYTMDVLSHARYAQARERASLARLLEDEEIQKAEDLLYIVLVGNFRDYAEGTNGPDLDKACELTKLLGTNFAASMNAGGTVQPKSRQALVEHVRAIAEKCRDVK